jgi:hypothetical protein
MTSFNSTSIKKRMVNKGITFPTGAVAAKHGLCPCSDGIEASYTGYIEITKWEGNERRSFLCGYQKHLHGGAESVGAVLQGERRGRYVSVDASCSEGFGSRSGLTIFCILLLGRFKGGKKVK